MSYLKEVKEKVEEGKLEVITAYKTYMEEIVIPDLVSQSGTSCATVYKSSLVEDGINIANFCAWLAGEGFDISTAQSGKVLTISY